LWQTIAVPTFYRIVKTDPPTLADFLSHAARGLPLRRDTPELRRSWERVSVYDSLERTRAIVARFPTIGRFIAELVIEAGGTLTYEQSGDDLHHFDVDGDPDELLKAVRQVVPA
jgi:hypothetical protein